MVALGDGAAEDQDSSHTKLSTLGRRFERSFAGQAVISSLVAVLVLIGVAWNLPNSQLKRSLTSTLHPVAAAAGIQNTWQMYAPDPISGLEDIQVSVTMYGGAERVWRWQPGDKVIGSFAWYRWQKLKERVIRDPGSRPGLAHWVVRQLTTPAERPVHVRILFRNEQLPPPGSAEGPQGIAVTNLYSEDLEGRP